MKQSSLEPLYKPADKYFVINNLDEDSDDIPISLPEPPDIREIDGYGLHPDEQYFHRLEVPRKLKTLERVIINELNEKRDKNSENAITGYKLMKAYWKEIESQIDNYKAEIGFIHKYGIIEFMVIGSSMMVNPHTLQAGILCFLISLTCQI